MKQLFVGTHPNTVRFADLDARDRVCEIRVLIANAYTILRDAIGERAKDEANVFHGPWLVFRNLMNEHPAACLEEFRHAAIYFDADTENMVTEIADLIEQHNVLVRQGYELKGIHQHQADAMIGIASTAGKMETTVTQGLGKTRAHNEHRALADGVRKYLETFRDNDGIFELCTLLTKRFGKPSFDTYEDSTVDEMFDVTCQAIQTTTERVDEVYDWVCRAIISFGLPAMPVDTGTDNQAADDENFALRS